MPVIKAVSSRATVGNALRYIEQGEKMSGGKLITSLNCDVRTAQEEFEQVKQYYGKSDGRQYKHYILSFDPKAERQPTPDEVLKITTELIQNTPHLQGFQSVIAVHTDREHSHAHIIVNSVNVLTGQKLHEDRKDLQDMKNLQDEISAKYGFEPPKKNKTIGEVRSFDTNTYKTIENKGQSAEIVQVYQAIQQAKLYAELPEQFCELMQKQGISTSWQESRKYITFTTENGRKFRDKTISKTFSDDISKESLTHEFCNNRQQRTGRIERPNPVLESGKSDLEKQLEELSREASDRSEREQEEARRMARAEQERIAREEERAKQRKRELENIRSRPFERSR